MTEFEYDLMRLRVQGYIHRQERRAQARIDALRDPRRRPAVLAEISRKQMKRHDAKTTLV